MATRPAVATKPPVHCALQVWSTDASALDALCVRVNKVLARRAAVVEQHMPRAQTWAGAMEALRVPPSCPPLSMAWFRAAMALPPAVPAVGWQAVLEGAHAYVEPWCAMSMSLRCALALPTDADGSGGIPYDVLSTDEDTCREVTRVTRELDAAVKRSWQTHYRDTLLADDEALQAAVLSSSGVLVAYATRHALEALHTQLRDDDAAGAHVLLLLEVPSPWAMHKRRAYNNVRLTSIAGKATARETNPVDTVLRELKEEVALAVVGPTLTPLSSRCWSLDITGMEAPPLDPPPAPTAASEVVKHLKALTLTLRPAAC